MFNLFRTIDYSVVSGFFGDSKEFHYGINDGLQDFPYLLCDTELPCFLGHLPEKLTDGLIVTEPLGHRQDVVSDTQSVVSAIWEAKSVLWHLPRPRYCLQSLNSNSRVYLLE